MKRRPDQRHEVILSAASTNQAIRVSDLAKQLNVSAETIRRDLIHLQAKGRLRRHFGGAVAHPVGTEPVWQERLTAESALRREAIALQGIKFIEEGDVLVVGPGATTYILAKHLAPQNRRLTIFTNNLAAATCFKAGSRTRVVVAPGDYDMAEGCTVGPETNAFFAKFRFDTMFFSVGGLTPEGGSDSVSGLAWSERTMLERSSRRILLVDHTKFNTAFLELVCPLSAIDIVVVDRQPSGPLREALALAKVNVVSAGEELAPTSDANVTSFPTQLKSESLPERTDDAQ